MKRLAMCMCLLVLGCGDDDTAMDASVVDTGLDSTPQDGGSDEGLSMDASHETSFADVRAVDSGDDGAPNDMGAHDAGDDMSLVDAGPRPICFHNRECEDDERCEDLSGMNMPHCVVGERGTGVFGAICTSENDCASAVCAGDERGSFCSDFCVEPPLVECADPLPQCLFGICLPPPAS